MKKKEKAKRKISLDKLIIAKLENKAQIFIKGGGIIIIESPDEEGGGEIPTLMLTSYEPPVS